VVNAAGDRPGDAAAAWEAIRADPAIQFAPVQLPEAPAQPEWLVQLFEFLGRLFAPLMRFIAANWAVIWPVGAVILALLALYTLLRVLGPDLARRRKAPAEEPGEWRPDATAALALLEEADRLAEAGRYEEATHLLLTRSVGQIAAARPELVEPSSTAREIASQPALPGAARSAFATIASRVERSLFALRRLSADDWRAARAAYAEFAAIASVPAAFQGQRPA